MIELLAQFWPLILALIAGGGGAIWGHGRAAKKAESKVVAAESAKVVAENKAERAQKVTDRVLSEVQQKESVNAEIAVTPVDDLRGELRKDWSRD